MWTSCNKNFTSPNNKQSYIYIYLKKEIKKEKDEEKNHVCLIIKI